MKSVVKYVLLLVVTSYVATIGFWLLSQRDDFLVALGVAVFLGSLAVWSFVLRWAKPNRPKRKRVNTSTSSATLLFIALGSLTGCTLVEPGHVGIKINQAGSNKGVETAPVLTGWVWYNPVTQDVFEYPTFVQTAVWTKNTEEGSPVNEEITFTTKDSMAVSADISLGFSLNGDQVPAFYIKFRSDDLSNFTHGFLRNLARDHFNEAAGKFAVEQIMGDNEPFITEVRGRLQEDLDPIGVRLEQFGFIGAPRPPEQVITSINAKVGAAQLALQKENEIRQANADAEKTISRARGEAEANRILAQSLTPNLMEWRRLALTEQAVARWNGQRPMVEGNAGGMLLQLPLQQSHP